MVFLSALLAVSAVAQEQNPTDLSGLSLEELAKINVESVYGASKFLQKASDAPASVTVVTAEQIQKYGFRTLADVLRTVRGFYVINDRNYSYVGVRGLSRPGDYNARILFLLDGHRVNDNIYDGAYVGTEFPVDVDLIERIEIVRGPNSSVYGTGAFVAVINVITKRGRDLGAAEVSTEAGSLNSYKGRVTYGRRFDGGTETLLSGSFYNSQGHNRLFYPEFDSPATNNGVAVDADRDQSYNFFADLIRGDFDVHFVQSSRTKHIPTASFGTVFDDPRTRTTDARGYLDVQYHHVFGSWETLGRVSYDWYDYHGIYVNDYTDLGTPPFTENYDAASGTWWDFQADAARTFYQRHKVTVGMEFRQDLQQQQLNYDIQPYKLYLDDHRSAWLWALYVQDEFSIRKNLSVVAGFRADWHQKYSNTLSPRFGLLFTPWRDTAIKASYSSAFRAPNSYEAFYALSDSATANPGLKPERIRSGELDIEQHLGKRYYALVALFLNHINGLVDQTLDPATGNPVFVNTAPVQTKGAEWELSARWSNGVEGSISDCLQDSREVLTGKVLTNSPKQIAQANLSFPLRKKLFASVDAQFVTARRTIAQTDLGSFALANVTLFTRKLSEHFDISGGVYNVFDKRYAESGSINHVEASIPQDGRSFRIKLSYRPYPAAK
ncbi:MAG TPA: TonB-dependent receptor [Methylomirabilota bacterium]|nr:TonB-dependent receptor [Methylomirabilota bacterium]